MLPAVRYRDGMKRTRLNDPRLAETAPRVGFASRRRAFSLLELLFTLAIILVMVTVLWGFGSRSHQQKQQKNCQTNLQKIFVAMQLYANDFNGKFPVVTNAKTSEAALAVLVPRYTVDTAAFICPGSKDSPLPDGESFLKRKISYAYYMGRGANDLTDALLSDAQVNTNAKTAGQQAFSLTGKPPGNNHHKYGGNFLFGDGHVERTPPVVPFALGIKSGVVFLNPKP